MEATEDTGECTLRHIAPMDLHMEAMAMEGCPG